MDNFLKDLEQWKETRNITAKIEEQAEALEEEDTMEQLEADFMKKADERELKILARLKEINIDPRIHDKEVQLVPQAQS